MIRGVMEKAMRFSIALVALIVAAVTTAEAQDIQSANAIMRGCRSLVSDSTIDDPTDSFLAGICAGTIDGLAYETAFCSRTITCPVISKPDRAFRPATIETPVESCLYSDPNEPEPPSLNNSDCPEPLKTDSRPSPHYSERDEHKALGANWTLCMPH